MYGIYGTKKEGWRPWREGKGPKGGREGESKRRLPFQGINVKEGGSRPELLATQGRRTRGKPNDGATAKGMSR